jgi:hypothetical protein
LCFETFFNASDSNLFFQEEFSSYEANEPFVRNLIGHLDNLLSEFKSTLTPINYDNLVAIVATEVSLQMEKVIMKTEFNRVSEAHCIFLFFLGGGES